VHTPSPTEYKKLVTEHESIPGIVQYYSGSARLFILRKKFELPGWKDFVRRSQLNTYTNTNPPRRSKADLLAGNKLVKYIADLLRMYRNPANTEPQMLSPSTAKKLHSCQGCSPRYSGDKRLVGRLRTCLIVQYLAVKMR
jgi:hypothetical protein